MVRKVDRNLGQVVVLDLILEVENLLFSRLQLLAAKNIHKNHQQQTWT